MSEYDKSIHWNPDARAWAKFFMETTKGEGLTEELMIGWFANAMMAMHDHLNGPCNAEMALQMMGSAALRVAKSAPMERR